MSIKNSSSYSSNEPSPRCLSQGVRALLLGAYVYVSVGANVFLFLPLQGPGASLLLTGSLLLRLYCCFGLPPVRLWPLSRIGESLANEGFAYFQVSCGFGLRQQMCWYACINTLPQ